MDVIPLRIAICINDHSEHIIQSVWELLFKHALAEFNSVWLIGHEPLLRQAVANSEILPIEPAVGFPTIGDAGTRVRIIPCHTVTPAELWGGRRVLPPGEIIQKSLDQSVTLGMETKIDVVFFTPFSIQALQSAGFWYQSLSSLLSEWTRFKVEERIFSIPTGPQYVLYQHLPFLALAPFPVEYERQHPSSRLTGADWMEIITHGINFRPEKN